MAAVNTDSPPVGYRFRPMDVELVSYFLSGKIKGLPIPELANGIILECSLYGKESDSPWILFKEEDPAWESFPNKKVLYAFSKPIALGNNRRCKFVRTAGCGTWEGKAVPQKIKNGKKVIGEKRAFTFQPKKGSEKEMIGKGHWIVYEYSLLNNNDYVICRVTKDLSKAGRSGVDQGYNGKRRRIIEEVLEDSSDRGEKVCPVDQFTDGFAGVVLNPNYYNEQQVNTINPGNYDISQESCENHMVMASSAVQPLDISDYQLFTDGPDYYEQQLSTISPGNDEEIRSQQVSSENHMVMASSVVRPLDISDYQLFTDGGVVNPNWEKISSQESTIENQRAVMASSDVDTYNLYSSLQPLDLGGGYFNDDELLKSIQEMDMDTLLNQISFV